jgi:hypothetical protein
MFLLLVDGRERRRRQAGNIPDAPLGGQTRL